MFEVFFGHIRFPNCLTCPGRVIVLRDLLHHLFAMGLQNPSETTMGLLSCLIGYQEYHDLDVGKMQKWFQFHQNMKNHMHSTLDRLRKVNGLSDGLLVSWPEDPQCLYHLSVFSEERPEKPRVSLEHLHHMADVLPLRKKHRYAEEDDTKTHDKMPMHPSPSGSSHLMQSQGLLQSAFMFANMFSGMKLGLSPTKLSMLTGSSQASSVVKMLEGSEPKSSNPTAASARPAGSQPLSSQPLALEDAKTQVTVPAPATPKPAEQTEGPVVQEAMAEEPVPKDSSAKKGGAGSVGRLPGLEAVDSIKAAMQLREESKQVPSLKRPASKMDGAVLKKPASKEKKTEGKGTGPVGKKNSCTSIKKKEESKKDSKVDFKGTVNKSQRHKWRPDGCSKCRHRKGCTDSCWIMRKYKPV